VRITIDPNELDELVTAFDCVKDDPVFAESAAAVRAGRFPAEMLQALSLSPALLEAFTAFSRGVYPGGLIERDVKEIVILEASRANQCQFCTQSHIAMCRMIGLADDPLAMLDDATRMTNRGQLAQELTRAAMANSNDVPDELFTRLRQAFTGAEIVELTFLIGFINCLNLFNNTLGVRYRGEYEDGAG